MHNVIKPIKSVLNKDKKLYYYNLFRKMFVYQLAEKQPKPFLTAQ